MFHASLKAAIAVVLIACATGGAVAQDGLAPPRGEWIVEGIGAKSVSAHVRTTLEFGEGGTVSGSGGCNRYRGTAEIKGGAISFGPAAATRMACPPPGMDQENQFFDALQHVKSWRMEHAKLLLLDAAGAVTIRLSSAASPASIVIPLPDSRSVETLNATYACGSFSMPVAYINAGGVSLAAFSAGGEFVVAANVLAASGAKYAGGRFIWWTKGDGADFYDLTKGENAAPTHCRKSQ